VAVDGGGQQVFAEAVSKYFAFIPSVVRFWLLQLTTSTRYGESRAAYREVEERHHDLQKVEKTLAELSQLFSDVRSPPLPLAKTNYRICSKF
jgi:syntaxin 1B/2/3